MADWARFSATILATAVGSTLITHAPGRPPGCTTDLPTVVAAAAKIASPGYSAEQLRNADVIIETASKVRLPSAAAVLGVMTAMAESGLRDLPYGDDAVNPDGSVADSVGLFQQQHAWGTRTERMDPVEAATSFYRHLRQVPDWQDMTPTAAAHAVQGNADPGYYTAYYRPAFDLVAHLTARHGPCVVQAGTLEATATGPPTATSDSSDTAAAVSSTFLNALISQGAAFSNATHAG